MNIKSAELDVTRVSTSKRFADLRRTTDDIIKRVSGGSGLHKIWWRGFYQPTNNEMITRFFRDLKSWVIDIMVLFIERSILRNFKGLEPERFKYVAEVVIERDNPPIYTSRSITKTVRDYAAYVVTMTFLQSNRDGAVGLLFFEDEYVDVFIPFPQAVFIDKGMQESAKTVINHVSKHYLGNKPIKFRQVLFSNSFNASNIWNVYYLLLRLQLPFDDVQKLFLDESIHVLIAERAFYSYKYIGQMIGGCVKYIADKDNDTAAKAAFTRFLGPDSREPMTLNKERLLYLVKFFVRCKIEQQDFEFLHDLVPIKFRVATSWPADVSPEWHRFRPITISTNPLFYF